MKVLEKMSPKTPTILLILYTIRLIEDAEAGNYATEIETEATIVNFSSDEIIEGSGYLSKIEEKEEETDYTTVNSIFYDHLEEINSNKNNDNKELSLEIVTHIPWNISSLNYTESQDTVTTSIIEESNRSPSCVLEISWCFILIMTSIACALLFIKILIFLEERKNTSPYVDPFSPVHDSII